MVRHTLKILQHLLQDFQIVPDHFGTLCIKGLETQTQLPTYLSVTRQKITKIDEVIARIDSYFPLIWLLSCLLLVYQLDIRVDIQNVFLLFKDHTFRKDVSGKNLIPTLRSSPKTLVFYLFSLLGTVNTFKFKRSVTQVKKKKKNTHKNNECFNMRYLKLMTKRFEKVFCFSSNLFFILNLQLIINPIYESNIYLLDMHQIDFDVFFHLPPNP